MLASILFCSLCFLWGSEALKPPPFIKICARNDPKFKECALKSAQDASPYIIKGDHKYHMPNMDPMIIDRMVVATSPGSIGLVIELENAKFYGMPEAQLLDFDMDFEKHVLTYKLRLPRSEMISNYNISGKVLILPITGHGLLNMTTSDFEYTLSIDYDLEKKDNGKEYMKFTEGNLESAAKKTYVHFDNLFNGDQLLGDQMNLFINENYEELRKELAPIFNQAVFALIKNLLSNTIGKIPYDDIFPIK